MESLPLIDLDNSQSGCLKLYLCNPKHFSHRVIILFLTCFIAFGAFFCYDNPSALQIMFMKDLDLSFESYMTLYSWYSWPNIVMSFIGGILIDNILGVRLAANIFGLLTIIGQLLLALGVFVNKLWLMDLARFIFGIGAESLTVAQNTYSALWFKDKELNIVFGLQISISRLGSTINANTMPLLYDNLIVLHDNKTSLALSLVIASITCFISLIFCFILGFLHRKAFKHNSQYSLKENRAEFHFSDIFKFNYGVWCLSIIGALFYSSVFPFVSLAQTLFVQKYQVNIIEANFANSLIYIISAVVSPVIGFGVDFYGKNLLWLSLGLFLLFVSHLITAFTIKIPVYLITILMGLSLSIVASSLWGLVTYMVPNKKQGTAFGLMQALINLGLGIVALIAGSIVDKYGYFVLELFFVCCSFTSFISIIILFKWNRENKGILNFTRKKRNKMTL